MTLSIMRSYPVIRLVASLSLMTIGGSAMYAAVIVLAPVAQEFETGRGAASLPYAFFMIGFGIGGVVMGRLADRFGIIVPAVIGSLCLPAGLYAASLAATMTQFGLALGVLCGFLGASFIFAPLVADVSHWFTVRRGLAVGIAISGSYVAGAVWPPVLQYFVDVDGWRATYVWLAVFTLCTMLPLCTLLYRRPETEPADGGNTAIKPLQHRSLAMPPNLLQCLICMAGVGCCVAMAMPQVHIVPYVLDLGYPAARGAEMLALMLGFGIVSRVMSGWISDRIGGLRTLLVGSLLQALVLVVFLTADSLNYALRNFHRLRPRAGRYRPVLRDNRAHVLPREPGRLAHRHGFSVHHLRHGARRLDGGRHLRCNRLVHLVLRQRHRLQCDEPDHRRVVAAAV